VTSRLENFMLPLFCITGASGAGKSAVAAALAGRMKDFVVLERDLWFGIGMDGAALHEFSLRMAKNINQNGRPVVMCGAVIPENYEDLPERQYFEAIHYLALVCDDDVLIERLKSKPDWATFGDQKFIDYHLDFNRWLKSNAATTKPPMTLLDPTRLTVEDELPPVEKWLRSLYSPAS